MTRTMLTTQLFAATAMLLVTVGALPAAAQTFDAAVEAYERGDYATALAGFQNYAEQGHAFAQGNLGFMYANGKGVPAVLGAVSQCRKVSLAVCRIMLLETPIAGPPRLGKRGKPWDPNGVATFFV